MFKSVAGMIAAAILLAFGMVACTIAPEAEENRPTAPSATGEPAVHVNAEAALAAATATPTAPATPAPPADTPEDAILSFYEVYLDYGANNCCVVGPYRSPLRDGVYRDSPYMTDDLKASIDEAAASMGTVGYDPILCGQGWPEWVRVWDVAVEGDGASATVETSLIGEDGRYRAFPVGLEWDGEGWLLAEIDCEGEITVSERPDEIVREADWQTYIDVEYGLSLPYPAGWAAQEAESVDEGAGVDKVVTFAPEGWEGMIAPLVVEIGGAGGEIEHTSTFEVEGRTVYVLEAASGEVFYSVEGRDGIRVTVRDSSLVAAGGDEALASTWRPFAVVMVYGVAASFD